MNTVAQQKNLHRRINSLDIAKGILILLVVLGHSSFPFNTYIYWFHIPAFFIIGGIVHKQPEQGFLKSFIVKKLRILLFPYVIFSVSLALIVTLIRFPTELVEAAKSLVLLIGRLGLSGGAVFGPFGAFWYIPCFFLTVISFSLLHSIIKNDKLLFCFLVLLYAIGIALTRFQNVVFFPWSVNLVPITIFYYGLGFYGKSIISRISRKRLAQLYFLLFLLFLCSTLICLEFMGKFIFYLDVKNAQFSNAVLAVVIPIIFTLTVLLSSTFIDNTILGNCLKYIGANSLIIMYLHFPIVTIASEVMQTSLHYTTFFLLGTSLSLLIGYCLSKFSFTSKYLLGKANNVIR